MTSGFQRMHKSLNHRQFFVLSCINDTVSGKSFINVKNNTGQGHCLEVHHL